MVGNLYPEAVKGLGVPPAAVLRYQSPGTRIKRIADVLLASLALLVLSPALCLIALAIKLDSPGPILFRQRRGGLHGRPFSILKFRTLNVLEDGASIRQITRDDCRITRVGRGLRRTSLDELPQLVNVVLGDMSLVGPRPHVLAHDRMYGQVLPSYFDRFAMRPGITGWAQINGARGATPTHADMKGRLDYDIWYIENWTLGLDARILAITTVAMLKMDAY